MPGSPSPSPSFRLAVRVTPGARRDELLGFLDDGTLRVKIASPPVEGRANEALLSFLSRLLGIPRSAIAVRSGAGSRIKVLDIRGLDAAAVRERLRTTFL